MQNEQEDPYIKFTEINYKFLIERVKNPAPTVLFFGAGASFGSDNARLIREGKLPPLGKDLYNYLRLAPETFYWKRIPEKAKEFFNVNFELGLQHVMENDSEYILFNKLLFELALFFAKFEPQKNNLYVLLAEKIKQIQTNLSIITLNYDPMLQHALRHNGIFAQTIGVQETDLIDIPANTKRIDVIYPHGACQFCYTCPKEWENEIFSGYSEIMGSGLCQYFIKDNIINAYTKKQEPYVRNMPLMCAYEPQKRPFSKNAFIDFQQAYYRQTIMMAKQIVLIGVNCNYEKDRHLWEVIEKTEAKIIFIEPADSGIERIKRWNRPNVQIIQSSFKDSFNNICELL